MRTDFAPFFAWCQSRGVTTPLDLVNNGSYRFMATPSEKKKLFSQSTSPDLVNIVTAPLDACITGQDWETLVEKLKYEKGRGDKSEYAPWLDLFPTLDDFQGMPRFWNAERRDFVRLYDSGQLEARMEIDRLRFNQVDDQWALAVVDSRSNFLPDSTYAVTPMLDMFNHKSSVRTSARVDGGDRFLLEVNKDSILESSQKDGDWTSQLLGMFGGKDGRSYKSGAEVFVSYGDFDNMETLCNYGFVDPGNEANVETFRVRLMGKAPAYLVVDSKGTIDNMINQLSLADLRVALATQEDLESDEWNGMDAISERDEIEVFALIAGELEESISDSQDGAEKATAMGDNLVAEYLKGRQRTLEKGRTWLQAKYPTIF